MVPEDVCSGPAQEKYSKDGFVTVRGHSILMFSPNGFMGTSTVEPITGDLGGELKGCLVSHCSVKLRGGGLDPKLVITCLPPCTYLKE